MAALDRWVNFYVIVGSSAGALIGLQFVVITLIADIPIHRDAERAGNAFATPTIVHFGAALLLAAVISMPWTAITGAAITWGILGFAGIVYITVVGGRIRAQQAYAPVLEDRLFHAVLPCLAYLTLAASAVLARWDPGKALFAVAASALLLLFVGIHNAWDAVTYHVFVVKARRSRHE